MSVEVKSAIDENSFDEKKNRLENSTLVNPCSEFIKPRHYKQLREKLENIVETSNKFELLGIENENDERSVFQLSNHDEVEDQNLKLEENKKVKKGKKKPNQNKCLVIDLSPFENKNQFGILTDNAEEKVENILKRVKLLNTSKRHLKKCKKCNFKKRSCLVDFSTCKSFDKFCSKCNKKGHFPQSQECKSRRKIKKENLQKTENPDGCRIKKENLQQTQKPFDINPQILFLLKNKIHQLEYVKEMEARKTSDERWSPDLKMLMESLIKKNPKWEKVLKVANKCAKKFSKRSSEEDIHYFIKYIAARRS